VGAKPFAASASNSDQAYVKPSAVRSLTLVLARVCLGRCQVVRDGSGRRVCQRGGGDEYSRGTGLHDSILTEVPGMRFREIAVGRDTAAYYPELLVEYEWV